MALPPGCQQMRSFDCVDPFLPRREPAFDWLPDLTWFDFKEFSLFNVTVARGHARAMASEMGNM